MLPLLLLLLLLLLALLEACTRKGQSGLSKSHA